MKSTLSLEIFFKTSILSPLNILFIIMTFQIIIKYLAHLFK